MTYSANEIATSLSALAMTEYSISRAKAKRPTKV